MRIVVFQRKMLLSEGEHIFYIRIHFHGRQFPWFSSKHCFNRRYLVYINMGIRKAVNVFIWLISGDLGERQSKSRILHHVLRQAKRDIARSLEHVQTKLSVNYSNMYPSMARADHHFLLFAFSAAHILRNPR